MIDRQTSPLVGLGYFLAAALICVPFVELIANAYPLTPTGVRWRYGFMGYLGNNLLLPTFGFGVAVFTALLLEHKTVIKALSILGGIGALGFIGASALFVLDALQIRSGVNPQISRSFDIATGKAGVALLFAILVGCWTAIYGWRASQPVGAGKKSKTSRKQKQDSSKLVAPQDS